MESYGPYGEWESFLMSSQTKEWERKQIVNFLIWKGKKKFLEAWGLHFQVLDTEFILKRNITEKKKNP